MERKGDLIDVIANEI